MTPFLKLSCIRDWLFSAGSATSVTTHDWTDLTSGFWWWWRRNKRNGTVTVTLLLHFLLSIAPRDYILLRILQFRLTLSWCRRSLSVSQSQVLPRRWPFLLRRKYPLETRENVALAPGHSPLDWAALKALGQACYFVNTMPHHLNFYLPQADHKRHLLTTFITWIYADFKYLSTGLDFIQIDLELVKLIVMLRILENVELPNRFHQVLRLLKKNIGPRPKFRKLQ